MRNRALALVVRDNKILMEYLKIDGRYFYTIPGGGIEEGETPEEAVIRELKEECGVDGILKKKLAVQYNRKGFEEHIYQVEISKEQEPCLGYDPELAECEQIIKKVHWLGLDEISERDRAHLFSYGLLNVDDVFETVKNWGDDLSLPSGTEVYLRSDNLVLKTINDHDLGTLVELFSNDDISKFYEIPACESNEDYENLARWFIAQGRDGQHYNYGIYLDKKLIGFINDCGVIGDSISIGFVTHPNYQNQGYMSEALNVALKHLREKGFNKVTGSVFLENGAAMKTMSKVGMKKNTNVYEYSYRGVIHKCVNYEIEF